MSPLPLPARFIAFESEGWLFVASTDPDFASRERVSAASLGGRALGAYLEEHVMVSGAFGASEGRLTWSVEHDPGVGLDHLEVWGEPPATLSAIQAELLEQLRTKNDADYLFDAPPQLAATVCGFDPNEFDGAVDMVELDRVQPDVSRPPTRGMARAGASAQAKGSQQSSWSDWLIGKTIAIIFFMPSDLMDPGAKKRGRGPGWVPPKAVAAAIQAELVPQALALGWVPRSERRSRRGESSYGQFEFERLRPGRIERLSVDFQYGDRPEIDVSFGAWTGEGAVCIGSESGSCWEGSTLRWLWRLTFGRLSRGRPDERVAKALTTASKDLRVIERYLREGLAHPSLVVFRRVPPYRWPAGHEEGAPRAGA